MASGCQPLRCEAQSGVFLKNLFQGGPICNVHFAEQIEISNHGEAGLILEQRLDGLHEAISGRFARKAVQHAAAVVLNAKALEKVANQLLMSSEQPSLQHLSSHIIIALPRQFAVHPGMAFHASFSLEDNRTKLPARGEHLKAGPISPFVVRAKVLKDLCCCLFRQSLQNLVRFHGRAIARMTESEWENTSKSSTLKI